MLRISSPSIILLVVMSSAVTFAIISSLFTAEENIHCFSKYKYVSEFDKCGTPLCKYSVDLDKRNKTVQSLSGGGGCVG